MKEASYSGTEVARFFGVTAPAVNRLPVTAGQPGLKKYLNAYQNLRPPLQSGDLGGINTGKVEQSLVSCSAVARPGMASLPRWRSRPGRVPGGWRGQLRRLSMGCPAGSWRCPGVAVHRQERSWLPPFSQLEEPHGSDPSLLPGRKTNLICSPHFAMGSIHSGASCTGLFTSVRAG